MGDFTRSEVRRSLREYRCLECRSRIPPLTRYVRTVGSYDGDFSTKRSCLECHEVSAVLLQEMREGRRYSQVSYDWGSMIEQGCEHACIEYPLEQTRPLARQILRVALTKRDGYRTIGGLSRVINKVYSQVMIEGMSAASAKIPQPGASPRR